VSNNSPATVWLTREQTTERLHVSLPYVDALIKTGALPAYQLGPRSVRIKLADVDALLTLVRVETIEVA
jgi:excisionase family DNA binding protein